MQGAIQQPVEADAPPASSLKIRVRARRLTGALGVFVL